MSVWYCECHGLHGPMAQCVKASRATFANATGLGGRVSEAPARAEDTNVSGGEPGGVVLPESTATSSTSVAVPAPISALSPEAERDLCAAECEAAAITPEHFDMPALLNQAAALLRRSTLYGEPEKEALIEEVVKLRARLLRSPVASLAPTLTFEELQAVNVRRCVEGFGHALADWSVAEWTNALCGEAGEAANFAKKMIRHRDAVAGNRGADTDLAALRAKLRAELADVVIYASLTAASQGFDLGEAVRETFNAKSQEIGSDIQLRVVPSSLAPTSLAEIPECVEAAAICLRDFKIEFVGVTAESARKEFFRMATETLRAAEAARPLKGAPNGD